MIEMSETELLQAFRKERSEEAFAELVRRYAGLVYSVARRRLSNAALAEDVTQLVFIRFAKMPPKVHSAGELAAWLHRTTVNVTIDTWRSETRRRNREQQVASMQPETNTATTNAFWDEISPGLDEAIDQLNDEDRQAILLRFFKAKPMRDVGAALGVSEAAAKMRVGRAVEKLRMKLGASAAATTAAALTGVLAERSIEAAPAQLVSRLAATKLPAAGAGGKGALLHSLSRASGVRLAGGVAGLAVIVIALLHFARSSAPVPPQATTKTSNAIATAPTGTARRTSQPQPVPVDLPALPPPKEVRIQFHVLDAETGAGLAGSRILFGYSGAGRLADGYKTVTDEKGDAAITEGDDPEKNHLYVSVTAEGHVPKLVPFGITPPADYTIKLDPAATANGVVVNEQGTAISAVKILIRSPGYALPPTEDINFWSSPVMSDENGKWSCSYIPKGTNEIRLILNKPGLAATEIQVPVNQAGLSNLTLVIDRGYIITGRVTDEQGGAIPNAEVRVLNVEPSKRLSSTSGEDGVFALWGVRGEAITNSVDPLLLVQTTEGRVMVHGTEPVQATPAIETNDKGGVVLHGIKIPGPLQADLAVQAEGFAPRIKTVALSAGTNRADFVLAPGNIFRGRVVDEAGNPISNAVAQTDFDSDLETEQSFEWIAHTDANGWFQWDSAPAEEICYWFEADGYESVRRQALAADGSEHRIVLKSNGEKQSE